jgi:hypothetical protein
MNVTDESLDDQIFDRDVERLVSESAHVRSLKFFERSVVAAWSGL